MTRFRNPHFCARKSAPQSQLLSRSVSAQHISGILTRFPCSAEQECVSGHKNRVAHLPQKLRIQFLEGVDGAAPSHNPPTVRARAAREDKNALSCSPWNSQRPSCTIGSSCYRYNGETCDRPKAPSTKRGLSPKATGGEIPAAADSLPLCKGSLWVLCLIVFCFSCILAEKFSFQREDGEYSDLRSRKVPEIILSTSAAYLLMVSHNGALSGKQHRCFWPQPLAHSSGRMA